MDQIDPRMIGFSFCMVAWCVLLFIVAHYRDKKHDKPNRCPFCDKPTVEARFDFSYSITNRCYRVTVKDAKFTRCTGCRKEWFTLSQQNYINRRLIPEISKVARDAIETKEKMIDKLIDMDYKLIRANILNNRLLEITPCQDPHQECSCLPVEDRCWVCQGRHYDQ